MGKLTPKQERFVQEYLIDLNSTQAAIRAGYSAKTADRIGPELLGKTCVSAAIAEAKKSRAKRTEITQDMVVQEVWNLYKCCSVLVPRRVEDGEREVGCEGKTVYKPLDATNANAALEKLMKHTGAYEKDNKREFEGGITIKWATGDSDKDGDSDG